MNFIKAATIRLAAILIIWLFLMTGGAVRAQSIQDVGEMGDPGKLVFEGNEHFSADNIRNGLMQSPEFLLTSHPSAPWDEYLPALAREIKSGYEAAGYPEAEVKTAADPEKSRILVRIKEGPRYYMADIHVSGAKKIPAATLIQKMQEKPDPLHHREELISERLASYNSNASSDEDANWTKGAVAGLGTAADHNVTAQVKNLLSQLGFDQAKIKVEQVQDPKQHTVDLRIEIL
jgi:hypothetical protein